MISGAISGAVSSVLSRERCWLEGKGEKNVATGWLVFLGRKVGKGELANSIRSFK